jgi:hypothetical protein
MHDTTIILGKFNNITLKSNNNSSLSEKHTSYKYGSKDANKQKNAAIIVTYVTN